MSGAGTAVAALGWLVGLSVLLRWPIVSVGCGVALVAWTWDPGGFWLALLVTGLVSLAHREYGPTERLLVRFPELAVALVAAVVAVLAGGQVASGALAVLVLSLGWLARTAVLGLAGPPGRGLPLPPPITFKRSPAPAPGRGVAPVAGFLGVGALRVDCGPCPSCGGLLVGVGRTLQDPARGQLFMAEAICTVCGRRLVGLADGSSAGVVAWIDPDDRREGIA